MRCVRSSAVDNMAVSGVFIGQYRWHAVGCIQYMYTYVMVTLKQAMKAQRWNRCIAVLFL